MIALTRHSCTVAIGVMAITVIKCCVCNMQPLLPPPILLLLGVVLFGSGEAARFRNYQKHGGGEVCSSSFRFPLVLRLHASHLNFAIDMINSWKTRVSSW